jgi:hypothetical protein
VDFALDTIGALEITLVDASLLNDPFDPYFFFETDFGEDYNALWITFVRSIPPISDEVGQQHVDEYNKQCGAALDARDAWQAIDYERRLPL